MRPSEVVGGLAMTLIGFGLPALFPSVPRAWGAVLVCVGVILLLDSCRRAAADHGLTRGSQLLVRHGGKSLQETLTFSIPPGGPEITRLIIEPSAHGYQVVIDPREVLFVHAGQPATCSVCVEENHDIRSLTNFLERRHGGKAQVWVRFTDSRNRRQRIPFNVELMGAHHRVEWVPGRAEDASPEW